MTRFALVALLLAGCDDTIFKAAEGGEVPEGTDFCAVQQIVDENCLGCHSAAAMFGGLDLETDLAGILSDAKFIIPNDAAGSYFYEKVTGTQSVGTEMPPGSPLDPALSDTIASWIDSGADTECGGGTTPTTTDTNTTDTDTNTTTDTDTNTTPTYHPSGYADAAAHGIDANLQTETCTDCHGADLTGDSAVSCDTCHASGWRTDCTFCHGGTDNTTGAPPRGIDGAQTDAAFGTHTAHVTGGEHPAYGCEQCHTNPTDALSDGHVFVLDTTAGIGEAWFGGGLSVAGAYDGTNCSNNYCHGDGQGDNGTIDKGSTVYGCDACHGASSSIPSWSTMSGEHNRHLAEGVACADCHSNVNAAGDGIDDGATHVDGTVDVAITELTYTAGNGYCTGTCHTHYHSNDTW